MSSERVPDPRGVVLVGVDGSPAARDAVALGATLGALLDAPPVLVCVHPPAALGARVRGGAFEERDADAARDLVEAVAWPGAAPPARRVSCAANAALGLCLAALEDDARLVVLGSSHRHGLGHAALGTTAMRLLAELDCPVAIAPAGWADRRHALRDVGLAYDGSSPARHALPAAVEVARAAGASLAVIDVATARTPLELARYGPAAAPMIGIEAAREEARDELADAVAAATASGVVPTTTILSGADPAAALADASEDLDLLVMGSHGRGTLERLVLGSTSEAVTARTRCPLLVVPGG